MTALKNVVSVFAFLVTVSLLLRYFVYIQNRKLEARDRTYALLCAIGAVLWCISVRLTSSIRIELLEYTITLPLFFWTTLFWREQLHDFGVFLKTRSEGFDRAG
jgi:hypothetical protein